MIAYEKYLEIKKSTADLIGSAEFDVAEQFKEIEDTAAYNQLKVLKAFRDNRVSETHFISSSGYGYDDAGREALDKVYAQVFECEDALVRHNIISGTHAISLCLFGVLRPGDTLLSATGRPYDTLEETIGLRGSGNGSLKDFGINYKEVPLDENGGYDLEKIKSSIDSSVKAVFIQRSKGYSFRKTLSVADIEKIISACKSVKKDIIAIVDNCYGELVERHEPTAVGADLAAGSLIKNPGGSLASTGGYIAGREELVKLCSYKLNSVGIGKECGSTLNQSKAMFQGLYLAPFVVSQALKTAVLAARVFEKLGYEVSPASSEKRSCIIEAIKFNDEKKAITFIQGIQKGAAVDSFVRPEPWDMPGYNSKVIMAAGAFNQGSSIELSADAPIKPPYIAYMQGGVTYEYGKIGILYAVDNLI